MLVVKLARAERDQFHGIQLRDRIGDVMPGNPCVGRQTVVADGRYSAAISECQDRQIDLHGVK